jgi:hypothetical protein
METKTSLYDFAESLETPRKMATYLEVCIQESDGVASLIVAKTFGDIVRPRGCCSSHAALQCRVRTATRHSLEIGGQIRHDLVSCLSLRSQLRRFCAGWCDVDPKT